MNFQIDRDDLPKLAAWRKEQVEKCAEAQKRDAKNLNVGAIGGLFSYTFTPTSIGLLVNVTCGITGDSLFLDGGL
jgi:hypothetical protein